VDFHYYASVSTLVDRAVLNKQILNHPCCRGLFVCYPCTCRHSSNYFMNEESILFQSCSLKKSQSFKITVARLHDIERLHVKSIDCLPWTRTRTWSLDCLPWTGTWSQNANPESFFSITNTLASSDSICIMDWSRVRTIQYVERHEAIRSYRTLIMLYRAHCTKTT
jgi:hypothetical protein